MPQIIKKRLSAPPPPASGEGYSSANKLKPNPVICMTPALGLLVSRSLEDAMWTRVQGFEFAAPGAAPLGCLLFWGQRRCLLCAGVWSTSTQLRTEVRRPAFITESCFHLSGYCPHWLLRVSQAP